MVIYLFDLIETENKRRVLETKVRGEMSNN